ncbi:MAG: Ig-like domain-containing protein [Candidatus Brocadiia bacterium]
MERNWLYRYSTIILALTLLGLGIACGGHYGSVAAKVSSTTPINAAENVPFNRIITATFTEAMDPLTITSTTFRVTGPGTIPVLGTVTYVGVTATFDPTSLLPSDTLFTATITSGARDVAGNALETDYVWTFMTGIIPDTTPPTVSSTVPLHLDTDVPFNIKLTAAFSEAMSPLTLTTATFRLTGPGTTPVAGTVTYIGVTATFKPTSPLASNTLFTATITTGAEDLADNSLAANYVWTFTTGIIPDTTPPIVSSAFPVDAASGVPNNRIVTVVFNKEMDPLTINTATFRVTGPGTTPVLGTVTYIGVTATFTPASLLPASTLFTATVTSGAQDIAGNALETDYVWTFMTGAIPDTIAPSVTSTFPVHLDTSVPRNRIITATFTEVMDPLTITTATFLLTGPGTTPVPGVVTYVALTATFTPTNLLAASTLYTATITVGATDVAANALETDYVWTFTTGAILDITPPTVSSTAPADAAINVTPNSQIVATFSEAMNPLKITTASFRVTGPGTIPVLGAVIYVGVTATFTPTDFLPANTLFTATISSSVKDIAGNALDGDYVWTFTTGAAMDIFPPAVILTDPLDQATLVPINRIITATFSEAMNPLTIITTSFLLTGPGITPVPGAVTYVGVAGTFTPTDLLAPNTLFTATVTTVAEDVAGNALETNHIWTFTTGAAPDTNPPTVLSTTPVDMATEVALDSSITATLSEAMAPLTISTATFLVTGPGTTPVSGSVTYLNEVATFAPTSALAVATEYTATITIASEDLAGNALVSDYVWTFTTPAAPPLGPAGVDLGSAGNYVLLCKAGISTTGTTSVVGDMGLSPAAQSYYTGFDEVLDSSGTYAISSIVTGKMYATDMATPTPATLVTAVNDLEAAFTDAAGRATPTATELGDGDISGMNLAPGLYKWTTGLSISGVGVTFTGGANDVWILQIEQDLTVAAGAMITLAGGAVPQNIYWQVSGQAVLGTGCNFKGIILCQTQIVLQTGATFTGRALAQTAITLDAAIVSEP